MSYTENIKTGISFLLQSQNPDGGIAIANHGDIESGIWTTAECLDAIISSHYLEMDISALGKILKMVQYLNNHFIVSNNDVEMGYWEVADGDGASTLTTGHAIHSLHNFMNKILSVYGFESITIGGDTFNASDIKKEITINISKAINWLQYNQQIDNGWGYTNKGINDSSIFCVYYVLKGFNSIGKTSANDTNVNRSCIFVKEAIKRIISDKRAGTESDFPNVLYGYSCLVSSGYFTKTDVAFRKQILKYIDKKWRQINKKTYMNGLSHRDIPFIFNMEYIVLDALLIAEEYNFRTKINKISKELAKKQNLDGSWTIIKNNKTETTWNTAEAIIVLGQIEQRFMKYQFDVLIPRKFRFHLGISAIFSVIASALLLYYFVQNISPNNSFIQGIPNAIIGFLGISSSIITIVEMFRK